MGPRPSTVGGELLAWAIIEKARANIDEENRKKLNAALVARKVPEFLKTHPDQGALLIVTLATSKSGDPFVGGMATYYVGMASYHGATSDEALANRRQEVEHFGELKGKGDDEGFLTSDVLVWVPPRVPSM